MSVYRSPSGAPTVDPYPFTVVWIGSLQNAVYTRRNEEQSAQFRGVGFDRFKSFSQD